MTNRAIICVDDEISILQSLERELQNAFGDIYIYEFAEDATEAIEIIEDLEAKSIDILIVVSDWLMPGIKGDRFLIELHLKYPKIIKIMLTGQAPEEVIEQVKEQANLYECLFKPWSEKQFIAAIKSALTQG